jgi:hypothetical protein
VHVTTHKAKQQAKTSEPHYCEQSQLDLHVRDIFDDSPEGFEVVCIDGTLKEMRGRFWVESVFEEFVEIAVDEPDAVDFLGLQVVRDIDQELVREVEEDWHGAWWGGGASSVVVAVVAKVSAAVTAIFIKFGQKPGNTGTVIVSHSAALRHPDQPRTTPSAAISNPNTLLRVRHLAAFENMRPPVVPKPQKHAIGNQLQIVRFYHRLLTTDSVS